MPRTYLDAAAARSGARVALLAGFLILAVPALYFALSRMTQEPSGRVRFDNEEAAEERKEAVWGLTEATLAGTMLGLGLWTAHRNRASMRLEIDDRALLYRSMFRELRARWEDVLGVEPLIARRSGPLCRALMRTGGFSTPSAFRIRTRAGDVLLPATMADAAQPLPEFLSGPGGPREITLMREIQARVPPRHETL
jgi:hypothetical protein